MAEELKGYKTIKKSEIDGYNVHIYQWDSPGSAFEPKYAVTVELKDERKCNIAIRTFTRDLITSMSLMDDKIETGIEDFDEKVLIYGECKSDILSILDENIRQKMMSDESLRMDINPKVIVVRRFGAAEKSEQLEDDLELALSIAHHVDDYFNG